MNTTLRRPSRSTVDRIRRILIDFGLPASSLADQAHFTHDLGLDSLDTVDLLIRVEAEFSIRIDDRDWSGLRTIDALAEYIAIEDGIAVFSYPTHVIHSDVSV